MKMFLQFWHAKTPVFTYPQGWLPWPVEWLLAFPRVTYGAVSINVWSMACGTVIALVGDTLLAMATQTQSSTAAKQKVTMEAGKQATLRAGKMRSESVD